jgi:UDP-N-acetylmuramoylalanine--D-glutamate ligase
MNIRPKLSWSDLRGARVGIWGLGVEGHANLRRLQVLGVTPILVDDAGSTELDALKTDAGGLDALATCDVVVKSPGISRYRNDLLNLEKAGIPVAGGLGLWMEEADRARVACITGTKGKSTTTSIAGHLLRGLGYSCFLGGNLGSPPWDPLAETGADFWLIETSSYQATDVATGPRVVAVTSLHPDHLNWHGGVDSYYRDKLSLCTLPGVGSVVSNSEDALVVAHQEMLGDRVRWVPDTDVSTDWIAPLGLLGRHNAVNAEMAQAVLQELGVTQASDSVKLAVAAEDFAQLSSRLQVIGDVGGRTFVDDSLSTNVLPTLAALDAFPDRRVALIVGGFDRDIDYVSLALGLQQRQSPVLVLAVPDNGPRIAQTLQQTGVGPLVEVRLAAGVQEATQLGYQWAGDDGVVLLSPAAPSFGQFRDYRDRAAAFAEAMLLC